MAIATYEPIATQTLSSSTASITFTSISASYTDLRIVVNPLYDSASGGSNLFVRYNSDSSTNYSFTTLRSYGTSISSSRQSSVAYINALANDGFSKIPNILTLDIFSYAGSTYKSTLIYIGNEKINATASNNEQAIQSALWRSTAAINTVTFTCDGNFNIGSTATIYGIKAA